MGKKDKEHRKKVLKRNIKKKHFENKMEKEFKQQIEKIKENFNMSGNSMSGNSEFVDNMSKLETISSTIDNIRDILNLNYEGSNDNIFNEENKINKEFEPEFNGVSNTIEDREIDLDTDMAGEFVKYEEVKNIFPANVEGSEEFNMSNTEQ